MKVITTIPPYAPFLPKLAAHPVISGVRLNTVMPIKGPLDEYLVNLKKIMGDKEIWIDLKCRQIRVSYGRFYKAPEDKIRHYKIDGKDVILDPSNPRTYGELKTPPWTEFKIDHKIKVDLSKGPVKCFFQNGEGFDQAQLAEVVDGDTLIMVDGPKKLVGGGESINIIDPSLEIEGFFTENDYKWIEAAKKAGVHRYMLSYLEKDSDVDELISLDKDATPIAKIESKVGVDWIKDSYGKYERENGLRLMAARGDLYMEVGMYRPEKILKALYKIVKSDPTAICASRILTSLRNCPRPSCSDITDVACMIQLGYKTFMMGDDICFDEESLMLALEMMAAIGKEYS